MAINVLSLPERLQRFSRKWLDRIHDHMMTEMSSAQSFCADLLQAYEVEYIPGRVFEQHPLKIRKPSNGGLFGEGRKEEYSQERMDLYLPEICIWEMKGPNEKLADHVEQVFRYWIPMQTRYVVLCNFREIWVWDTAQAGGTRDPLFTLKLEALPDNPDALLFLRGQEAGVLSHSEKVTREIAGQIGRVIQTKVYEAPEREREAVRERLTKFALECVFAMFAEDSGLIPSKLFTVAIDKALKIDDLAPVISLFMDFDRADPAERSNPDVPFVNGELYDGNYPAVRLERGMLTQFHAAAKGFDWREVRAEVFGSIFEMALDRDLRHELGAHFTGHEDIMKVVEPTVVRPWRERIAACRNHQDFMALLNKLRDYHILDPACGCGNFLYIAYREMKRLERYMMNEWERCYKVGRKKGEYRSCPPGPYFTVANLHGIDIQPWAVTLTRVVLWIGEHLANQELDLGESILPLKSLKDNIICADALFTDWFPREKDDPRELAIIGNPPFMGRHKMRAALGDDYVDQLHKAFPNNRNADLVTYWYPKAIAALRKGERAGFVSSNSIAQNESREASLDKIIEAGGTIHDAWKSYPWPGEAAVHVSIVNWISSKFDGQLILAGTAVISLGAQLSAGTDMSSAKAIRANEMLCFKGIEPGCEQFIIDRETRERLLLEDAQSANVIMPFIDGRDLNRSIDASATRWIIDFTFVSEEQHKLYPAVLKYLREHVYPLKIANNRKTEKEKTEWTKFRRTVMQMRMAISNLDRFVVVPHVSPHVLAAFLDRNTLCSNLIEVIALDSYYHFGILQSAIHEYWAWARGSTLKGDLRYTNTTIFETFPFPLLLAAGDGAQDGARDSVPYSAAEAAAPKPRSARKAGKQADLQAASAAVEGAKGKSTGHSPALHSDGHALSYNPRVVPDTPQAARVSAVARELYEKRQAACKALNLGLTKLYNLIKGKTPLSGLTTEHQAMVTELQVLHEQLNAAVCACYGWPEETWRDENEVLRRLLELNQRLSAAGL
ncbi:class I SAM-dependent DNA methyltransferase [bacterium]|nr:class I SAM-dependent DNA methyltransferase [bacterium]